MERFNTQCWFTRETPKHYAELYKRHDITRCHVIKLGPNNDDAAKEALSGWPNGLQVGGGITSENAQTWLDYGASKVCGNSLSHIPLFSPTPIANVCVCITMDPKRDHFIR